MTTTQALYKSARFMYYSTGARVILLAADVVGDLAQCIALFYVNRERK